MNRESRDRGGLAAGDRRWASRCLSASTMGTLIGGAIAQKVEPPQEGVVGIALRQTVTKLDFDLQGLFGPALLL